MKRIIKNIRDELKNHIDPEYKISIQRFFKKGIKNLYGVRTADVRKISGKFWKNIEEKSRDEIFTLCNELLESGTSEERGIAFNWAYRLRDRYKLKDFILFESWIEKYVDNWAACDSLCTGAFGEYMMQFPKFLKNTKKWVKSDNKWFRRASAVILIPLIKKGEYLEHIFKTADLLLTDGEDMVQKGYGWMLKETSNRFPEEVFRYVLENKKEMPRTALRYAIEKLSPEMKKEAMRKDFNS